MKVLITGSHGLVGFESALYFLKQGHDVVGIDNDMRGKFFGQGGSTEYSRQLLAEYDGYTHHAIDLRESDKVESIFSNNELNLIIHSAAQPSHDYAASIMLTDFDINARVTVTLLEYAKTYSPDASFVYLSTNKVYGTHVNQIALKETDTRFEYQNDKFRGIGINESMSIDNTVHSFMGVSKLAGDLYVQEFGKYFGLNTVCFRCGCITGAQHAGVSKHGFLNYFVKQAVSGGQYTIYGHKGKQVRDNIHPYDLACAFDAFHKNPSQGEVYNLGGGYDNSISILEAINIIKEKGFHLDFSVTTKSRIGDHICYYSDNQKFISDYPDWKISVSLNQIIAEIIERFNKS